MAYHHIKAAAIGAGLEGDSIEGVYRMVDPRRYFIALKDGAVGEVARVHGKVVSHPTLKVEFAIRDSNKSLVSGTLRWVPPSVRDSGLRKALAPYSRDGLVTLGGRRRDQGDCWPFRLEKKEGMELPYFLRLGINGVAHTVMVHVPGRGPACSRCFQPGHVFYRCPTRRAARLGTPSAPSVSVTTSPAPPTLPPQGALLSDDCFPPNPREYHDWIKVVTKKQKAAKEATKTTSPSTSTSPTPLSIFDNTATPPSSPPRSSNPNSPPPLAPSNTANAAGSSQTKAKKKKGVTTPTADPDPVITPLSPISPNSFHPLPAPPSGGQQRQSRPREKNQPKEIPLERSSGATPPNSSQPSPHSPFVCKKSLPRTPERPSSILPPKNSSSHHRGLSSSPRGRRLSQKRKAEDKLTGHSAPPSPLYTPLML